MFVYFQDDDPHTANVYPSTKFDAIIFIGNRDMAKNQYPRFWTQCTKSPRRAVSSMPMA